MKPVRGGRFCDSCEKVVHDLSAMSEIEARHLLDSTPAGRVCIRYVYDADRPVVFGGVPRTARIIPEHALTARLKRRIAMAMVAAPLLVEACGGAGLDDSTWPATDGGTDGGSAGSGGSSAGHLPNDAGLGGSDAGHAPGDAGVSDASPDATEDGGDGG